jgi:Fur family ferric uptake transcriptional regulator
MNNLFVKQLKENGLKTTPQRIAILDILVLEKQPLCAEDIYLKLKLIKAAVNLSTVYRTLEAMTEKNILSKLTIIGQDSTLYEYNAKGHRHYLICKGCKKITTVYDCPLGNYEKSLEQKTDYKIDEHKLFLYGYCPLCNKK